MSVPSRVDIAEVIEKHEGVEVLRWFRRLLGASDAGTSAPAQKRTWYPNLIFIWCGLVMMADGYDNQVINYAAPAIIQDWGISRAAMAPVLTSSIIGWLVGSILFSMLADRIGRRNAILIAMTELGLFTLAIPYATNLLELGVLRFLAALGIGGAMPLAVALMAEYSKSKSRGLMITLLFLGYTCGSSGGGFLASYLIPTFGWQSAFYVGGVGAVAIGLVLLAALPESVRYLVMKGAPIESILPIVRKLRPSANYDSSTAFYIEEKKVEGLPVSHLFTDGRAAMTAFLWAAMALAAVTHFFLSSWIAVLLTPANATPEELATAIQIKAIFQFGAALSFTVGWLLDRYGINAVVSVLVLAAPPVIALGFVDAGTFLAIAMSSISGILVLGGGIGLNAIAGSVYPTAVRSTGTGAAFAAARVGAALGPAAGGVLLAAGVSVPMIFTAMAIPHVLAGVATWMILKAMTPETAQLLASKPAMVRGH
jgi:AAHS family 4-hydroxybenzoate transporter-like MFS transporter